MGALSSIHHGLPACALGLDLPLEAPAQAMEYQAPRWAQALTSRRQARRPHHSLIPTCRVLHSIACHPLLLRSSSRLVPSQNGRGGEGTVRVPHAHDKRVQGRPLHPIGISSDSSSLSSSPWWGGGGDGHERMGGNAGVTCNAVSARGNALPSSSSSPSEGASSAPLMSPLREESSETIASWRL